MSRIHWFSTVAAAFLVLSALSAAAEPTVTWTDQFDGDAAAIDTGLQVLVASDGNPVVGGESAGAGGAADLFIRKLDRNDGSQLWSVRQAGIAGKDMALSMMTWDSAGQLLVAAFIRGCLG